MLLKGVFTTVVGLATIVGTYMYAVDNKWIEDVPDLRMASKTIEVTPPATAGSTSKDTSSAVLRSTLTSKSKRVRSSRRKVASSRTRRTPAKRRTVNIFKAAKDIPHPNTQR